MQIYIVYNTIGDVIIKIGRFKTLESAKKEARRYVASFIEEKEIRDVFTKRSHLD